MECHGSESVKIKLKANQEEQVDAHLKTSDDVKCQRELQNDSQVPDYAMSGRVLASIHYISHDTETVCVRCAIALRRRVPR